MGSVVKEGSRFSSTFIRFSIKGSIFKCKMIEMRKTHSLYTQIIRCNTQMHLVQSAIQSANKKACVQEMFGWDGMDGNGGERIPSVIDTIEGVV